MTVICTLLALCHRLKLVLLVVERLCLLNLLVWICLGLRVPIKIYLAQILKDLRVLFVLLLWLVSCHFALRWLLATWLKAICNTTVDQPTRPQQVVPVVLLNLALWSIVQ